MMSARDIPAMIATCWYGAACRWVWGQFRSQNCKYFAIGFVDVAGQRSAMETDWSPLPRVSRPARDSMSRFFQF